MKTRGVVGYVAVAAACAYGCTGPSTSSVPASATYDADAAGRDGALSARDAHARDAESDVASDDPEGGAVDGATDGAPSSESSQYCCVSGAYYVCPSAGAFAQCASNCTRDPSNDATCGAFSAGSSGGGALAPPPTPTNACGGLYRGFACTVGGDCNGLGHCTQNLCFPNEPGNPCTYPADCGDGNHCTNGCCASPANGSACTAPWDCDSGTCNNGLCQ